MELWVLVLLDDKRRLGIYGEILDKNLKILSSAVTETFKPLQDCIRTGNSPIPYAYLKLIGAV